MYKLIISFCIGRQLVVSNSLVSHLHIYKDEKLIPLECYAKHNGKLKFQ